MASTNSSQTLKILITGGAGFLGRHIVLALSAHYPSSALHIIDILPKASIAPFPKEMALTGYHQLDITSAPSVASAIDEIKPDVIVHTAGAIPAGSDRYAPSAELRRRTLEVNLTGTRNLLDAARKCGTVRAFVYTSSCTAVTDVLDRAYANWDEGWADVVAQTGREGGGGNGAMIYGVSKARAEREVLGACQANAVEGNGFNACVLRPAPTFGEGDESFLPLIIGLIEKGQTWARVGDGLNLWDVAYAPEVARAHVLAVEALLDPQKVDCIRGQIFAVQCEEKVSARDFFLAVWKECGHVPGVQVEIPVRLAWWFGLASEVWSWRTGKQASLSRGSVQDAVQVRYANSAKLKRVLGYEQELGLEEAIRRSCRDYRKRRQGLKHVIEADGWTEEST